MKNGEAAFQTECLKAHNEYRVKHGVPPLKLSKKICQVSKDWASKLVLRGKLEPSQNSAYGENIYNISSSDVNFTIDGRAPVASWYKEIKNHTFGIEPGDSRTDHFTQVVWKESKQLGVGCAKNKKGQIFVVANYYPPGNFVGRYTVNVLPIGGYSGD